MNKLIKYICVLAFTVCTITPVFADFKEHYDLGQQYLLNYQYSGAITEFKNALRINYLDNSARIGLINSYHITLTHLLQTDLKQLNSLELKAILQLLHTNLTKLCQIKAL